MARLIYSQDEPGSSTAVLPHTNAVFTGGWNVSEKSRATMRHLFMVPVPAIANLLPRSACARRALRRGYLIAGRTSGDGEPALSAVFPRRVLHARRLGPRVLSATVPRGAPDLGCRRRWSSILGPAWLRAYMTMGVSASVVRLRPETVVRSDDGRGVEMPASQDRRRGSDSGPVEVVQAHAGASAARLLGHPLHPHLLPG
jgi:hypothetical protein